MRATFFGIVAALLAGCAATPATNVIRVHDQKYNIDRYAAKQADSDFVGTSATATATAKVTPSWYKFGHP